MMRPQSCPTRKHQTTIFAIKLSLGNKGLNKRFIPDLLQVLKRLNCDVILWDEKNSVLIIIVRKQS